MNRTLVLSDLYACCVASASDTSITYCKPQVFWPLVIRTVRTMRSVCVRSQCSESAVRGTETQRRARPVRSWPHKVLIAPESFNIQSVRLMD